MSKIFRREWTPVIVATLMLASSSLAQAQEPTTGKKVGEKFDEAVQDVKSGLRRAGDGAKDQFAKAKLSVHNMGIESRVYGRIHWDKALNDATIELATTEEGVITMTGQVADLKAKARAVELTKETVGVTKVVDQLTIRPAPVVTPATNL